MQVLIPQSEVGPRLCIPNRLPACSRCWSLDRALSSETGNSVGAAKSQGLRAGPLPAAGPRAWVISSHVRGPPRAALRQKVRVRRTGLRRGVGRCHGEPAQHVASQAASRVCPVTESAGILDIVTKSRPTPSPSELGMAFMGHMPTSHSRS